MHSLRIINIMKKQFICNVCKKKVHFNLFNNDELGIINKRKYYYIDCIKCGLMQIHPLPNAKELEKYYKYNSKQYSDYKISLINRFLKSSKIGKKIIYSYFTWSYKTRAKLIKQYKSSGSILDVGCAQGNFLNNFSGKYWDKTGIELNPMLVKIAKKNFLDQKIINKFFESYNTKKKYDVVTLWQTFEHMQSPNKILIKLSKIIKHHGFLIIEVPNSKSLNKSLFKNYWQLFQKGEHLFFWSAKSLTTILKLHKFKIRKIYYPIFDTSTSGSLVNFLSNKKIPQLIVLLLGLMSIPLGIVINLFVYDKRDNMQIIAQKL